MSSAGDGNFWISPPTSASHVLTLLFIPAVFKSQGGPFFPVFYSTLYVPPLRSVRVVSLSSPTPRFFDIVRKNPRLWIYFRLTAVA
jgi:hypothetical protein